LAIHQIVIVLNESNLKRGKELLTKKCYPKVTEICLGGRERSDSVAEGLKRLTACSWVVIHDGDRPCIGIDLIERGLAVAQETGAVVAAVPVKETIKVIDKAQIIKETPSRENLWIAQTPQIFRFEILKQAYSQKRIQASDDATLVESLGYQVKVYPSSYQNIKVTTPEDLALAEIILRAASPLPKIV
jgi:2-C-methyl-D-erythritol 4-phosphate cytidylyltransferase